MGRMLLRAQSAFGLSGFVTLFEKEEVDLAAFELLEESHLRAMRICDPEDIRLVLQVASELRRARSLERQALHTLTNDDDDGGGGGGGNNNSNDADADAAGGASAWARRRRCGRCPRCASQARASWWMPFAVATSNATIGSSRTSTRTVRAPSHNAGLRDRSEMSARGRGAQPRRRRFGGAYG
eukprot:scaffold734_cov352-Prasinococcus_capsulatus_cf.AAC.7